jgi:hypothetical protein
VPRLTPDRCGLVGFRGRFPIDPVTGQHGREPTAMHAHNHVEKPRIVRRVDRNRVAMQQPEER